jgi:hypothetical protein
MGNKNPMKKERVMFSTSIVAFMGVGSLWPIHKQTLVKYLFECEVAYS